VTNASIAPASEKGIEIAGHKRWEERWAGFENRVREQLEKVYKRGGWPEAGDSACRFEIRSTVSI
jgi:hypothetical protein